MSPSHPNRSRRRHAPGSKSKPLGRPALTGGRVKFTTTLPERVVAKLREIGNGNASQAIIALVEAEIAKSDDREGRAREYLARHHDD